MDNPQHYQPLSHALNPPLAANPQYSTSNSNFVSGSNDTEKGHEDEEEEDDEGMVEEQLHENDRELQHPNSDHASPEGGGNEGQQVTGTVEANGHITDPTTNDVEQNEEQNSPPKRRPGRPRGSKNRMKGKATSVATATTSSKKSTLQPIAPTDVNPQNQQYYEFQWRVLNLCAEFYGAAEELLKATPALVVAQSYQMGPSIKIDPITMLNEAKRVCDTLLANPSQLTTNPPPPMFTQIATFADPSGSSGPSHSASTTGKFSAKPSVISNAQSFTLPLAAQAALNQPMQLPPTTYPPPPPQSHFPTLPYYYAPPPYAGASYIPISSVAPTISPSAQPSNQVVAGSSSGSGSQGAWTDEEQERLKQLAEQSKSVGKTGEIEWDWVVHQWGPSRTRHQVLIKATTLGLKSSSTRGQKRRRDSSHGPEDDDTPAPASTTSASAPPSVVPQAGTSTSSPLSQPVSSHASPALQPSHPPQLPAVPTRVTWPAPIIAANTPSPIISSSHAQSESQRGNYYRHRPSDANMKPDSLSSHHYVYHPNGTGAGTPKFSKQNGQ